MESFPPEMAFQLTWRTYQARVLKELETHLGDNHLHVVAAPGSGKTVLGLEVLRRLNRPTLILAPTLAIRNQWIDRLQTLFLPSGAPTPEWISRDVRNPAFLTVGTYQALHMAGRGLQADEEEPEEEEEHAAARAIRSVPDVDVCERLKAARVGTLVIDEAHHLRSEWWKTLAEVKKALNPVMVALTATPPYDVPPHEWQRYKSMCGPVDAEVAVPELVARGNLCPHQDYIRFSTPSEEEAVRIETFRRDVENILGDIKCDDRFVRAIGEHPWLGDPEGHIEQILDNPAYVSSMAIFLTHANQELPDPLLDILGVGRARIPKLDLEWMETLLEGCLIRDEERYAAHAELMAEIERKLRRAGAIERRSVRLTNPKRIAKLLAASATKLASVAEIMDCESEALGEGLRAVILTDFIRRADLPRSAEDIRAPVRLGVAPIFETLRRQGLADGRLGVLTGSLVIIPADAAELLLRTADGMGMARASISLCPLRHDSRFLTVDIAGEDRQRIVRLVTRVFSEGGVRTLVGTTALLGEGWDAPSVNTLVLASYVGSYMLSNQMRGRAIRVQPGNPGKTANIWHLVCADPGNKEGGGDYQTLARRCKAFVGVSFAEPLIANGVERFGLDGPPFTGEVIERTNAGMRDAALDRDGLRDRWDEALEGGVEIVEEIQAETGAFAKGFLFTATIKSLLWTALTGGLTIFCYLYSHMADGARVSGKRALVVFAAAFACAAVFALCYLVKAGWLYLTRGPVAGGLRQIGRALIRGLAHVGALRTDISKLSVRTRETESGHVYCCLVGGTSYEKGLFLDALREILDPIDNPRYLLVRRSALGRLLRTDYHAVPEPIGRRKQYARYYLRMWRKFIGKADLVYTRSVAGRKILLKARNRSLSAAFAKKTDRTASWK